MIIIKDDFTETSISEKNLDLNFDDLTRFISLRILEFWPQILSRIVPIYHRCCADASANLNNKAVSGGTSDVVTSLEDLD